MMKSSTKKIILLVAVVALVALGITLLPAIRYRIALWRFFHGINGGMMFYGKVIDHRGEPVPGATVGVYTRTTSQYVQPWRDPRVEVTTDQNGRFKIQRVSGNHLRIEFIKKDGYRFATSGYVFGYNYDGGRDPHRADPQRPVEFLLIPDRFKMLSRIVPPGPPGIGIHWNSGPVEVPIGETGEVLVFHPTRDMTEGEKKGFSWKVEIGIRNGMLLMRNKSDLLPLAPLDGYQPQVVLGYERGAGKWGGGISDRAFVFKTAAGNYGRFRLSLDADGQDERKAVLVVFFFNPTGERYLD